MQLLLILMISASASKEKEPKILENSEQNSILEKSNFVGLYYNKKLAKWTAYRYSKKENKDVYNGSYKDEETAARASDTLARELMEKGEKGHKLNFPDDNTEVHAMKGNKYLGVCFQKRDLTWRAQRFSKNEKKVVNNGTYKNEETAAYASDTLARELMEKGEKGHKLNFPDDNTEVHPKEKGCTSEYIGVTSYDRYSMWRAQRRSKHEKRLIYNGYHKDEETAAHASDTLVRKLIANGEKGHKLNFPDDHTEVFADNQTNKRKRPENHQKIGLFVIE